MTKREAELKSLFTQEFKRQYPDFLMLRFTDAGAPDRSIIGNKVTTYWEFKHATPHFDSPGNQELMCMRLAEQSFCRYVLWYEKKTPMTLIVHPKVIHARKRRGLQVLAWCEGFDQQWLARYIYKIHTESAEAKTARLRTALKDLLDWSTSEYQSNQRIDAQARAALAEWPQGECP